MEEQGNYNNNNVNIIFQNIKINLIYKTNNKYYHVFHQNILYVIISFKLFFYGSQNIKNINCIIFLFPFYSFSFSFQILYKLIYSLYIIVFI